MRKLFAMALFLSGTFFFTSCNDDDDNDPSKKEIEAQQAILDAVSASVSAKVSTDASATGFDKEDENFDWTKTNNGSYTSSATETIVVEGQIDKDTTFTADKIWEIRNRVTILSGVTLTIEKGTLIKGATSVDGSVLQGVDASVLMIARGAKIMAQGTADEPIIMTATEVGDGSASVKGKWGGLVVLGNAPISAENSPTQIEGVPANDTNGLYGGEANDDNSGVITYVSIRHGGAIIDAAEGDEINGLTLGGVGSGTTIHHVEVYANSDDGIEFFGGSVDVEYAMVTQVGDDAIDIDQSYTGTVSKFVVIVDGDTDEALEIDGREGAEKGSFALVDGSAYAEGGASITCDFKSKAQGSVTNFDADGGKIMLRSSFSEDDILSFVSSEDAAKNVVDGSLTFSQVNATWEVYTEDLPALLEE